MSQEITSVGAFAIRHKYTGSLTELSSISGGEITFQSKVFAEMCAEVLVEEFGHSDLDIIQKVGEVR